MQKKIIYFFIFTVVALLQMTFISVLAEGKPLVDGVLMMILAWSVLDGFFAFFNWAIVFGVYYDLITHAPVGEHALIFMVIVYFVSFFSRRFSLELKGVGLILFFGFIVFATFISHTIIAMILAIKLQAFGNYWQLFGGFDALFLQILFNTAFFYFSFVTIKKIKKFFAISV